jgi:hypothetical protein
MERTFIEHCEEQHLIKREIKNKIQYLSDLKVAISQSLSGRIGAEISLNFLFESEYMIANAIRQYELGYFDSAFFSLRSILELFMLLVYFIEHQTIDLDVHVKRWNHLEHMDTYARMNAYLKSKSDIFKDITTVMYPYFENLEELNKKLNKKVHKQSFTNFYVNRSHPVFGKKYDNDKEQDFFEESVIKIIGAIVVFRLFIDPMPVLLMDKEIFLRTKDTMSGPLTISFVEKYIGTENIENYKKCEMYQLHYEQIMRDIKYYESVADIMKFKTIDMSKIDEIKEQFEYLYKDDKLAFRIACESNQIYAIDVYNGVSKYWTSNTPNEKQPYFRNMEHQKYLRLENDILNLDFQDIVISIFVVDNKQRIFVEQAKKVDIEVLSRIRDIVDLYKNDLI